MEYTNDRAYEAIEEDSRDATQAVQERAFVHVLAYTGVRDAEVFRVNGDARELVSVAGESAEDYDVGPIRTRADNEIPVQLTRQI